MDRVDPSFAEATPFELDDIVELPGTYYNPRTEVTVIVDDTGSIDQGTLPETEDGADWIRVSEEPAINEQFRDELLERFETGARDLDQGGPDPDGLDLDDGDFDSEEERDELGPGFDPED